MAVSTSLKLNTPIGSVQVLDEATLHKAVSAKAAAQEAERTRAQLSQVCAALTQAVNELQRRQAALFSSQKEHIVRLSLEIAAKILAKEIADGHYAIETIVLDALQSAPPAKQTTIRLHPDDVKAFQKAAAELGLSLPPHTELLPDWSVHRAECVIESELGTVEYLIDEHLRQIGQALLGAEASV